MMSWEKLLGWTHNKVTSVKEFSCVQTKNSTFLKQILWQGGSAAIHDVIQEVQFKTQTRPLVKIYYGNTGNNVATYVSVCYIRSMCRLYDANSLHQSHPNSVACSYIKSSARAMSMKWITRKKRLINNQRVTKKLLGMHALDDPDSMFYQLITAYLAFCYIYSTGADGLVQFVLVLRRGSAAT